MKIRSAENDPQINAERKGGRRVRVTTGIFYWQIRENFLSVRNSSGSGRSEWSASEDMARMRERDGFDRRHEWTRGRKR